MKAVPEAQTPVAVQEELVLRHGGTGFSCRDAERLAEAAMSQNQGRHVVADLTGTEETCSGALARLILLRRDLLNAGGDLRIRGLQGRAQGMYEVSRLADVLPREGACDQPAGPGAFCRLDPSRRCQWPGVRTDERS